VGVPPDLPGRVVPLGPLALLGPLGPLALLGPLGPLALVHRWIPTSGTRALCLTRAPALWMTIPTAALGKVALQPRAVATYLLNLAQAAPGNPERRAAAARRERTIRIPSPTPKAWSASRRIDAKRSWPAAHP